jgi:hypothetical protein
MGVSEILEAGKLPCLFLSFLIYGAEKGAPWEMLITRGGCVGYTYHF